MVFTFHFLWICCRQAEKLFRSSHDLKHTHSQSIIIRLYQFQGAFMSYYNRSALRDGMFLALSWLGTSIDYFNHCKTHFKSIQSVPPSLSFRRKSKQYTFCKTLRLTYDCPNIGRLIILAHKWKLSKSWWKSITQQPEAAMELEARSWPIYIRRILVRDCSL